MGSWLGLTIICLAPVFLPWYISFIRYLKPATMVEEITLPARFLTTAAHLVCGLTVFYDVVSLYLQLIATVRLQRMVMIEFTGIGFPPM
jgi:hypothetical protein